MSKTIKNKLTVEFRHVELILMSELGQFVFPLEFRCIRLAQTFMCSSMSETHTYDTPDQLPLI